MPRKSKQLIAELEQKAQTLQDAQFQLKTVESQLVIAEEEEKNLLQQATDEVNAVMTKYEGMMCGIVLSKEMILKLLEISIESKEDVSLPFMVYYLEK